MGSVAVTDDLAVLAVVVGVTALAWLVVSLVRSAVRLLLPGRPPLPDEDCAPAGLGRLVPEGAQVAHEARTGTVALELWLAASHRRRTAQDRPGPVVPRQRSARRSDTGAAREAG